jgi:biotin transport system substrate-specific component
MLSTVRSSLAARPAWQIRALRVAFFIALTAMSARLRIALPNNPVPITAQTLIVLLAGLTLGPIDGALSQLGYIALIAVGAPLDANGLGPAVFLLPTVGYLVGFVPGALIAGLAYRNNLPLKIVTAFAGAMLIHIMGIAGLMLTLHIDMTKAIGLDVAFIPADIGKALLAASLINLGAASWQRWGIAPKP